MLCTFLRKQRLLFAFIYVVICTHSLINNRNGTNNNNNNNNNKNKNNNKKNNKKIIINNIIIIHIIKLVAVYAYEIKKKKTALKRPQ